MSLLVKSFFTVGGVPATGLSPTIRIWEVSDIAHTLIVGGPDPTMTEIGDGWYKYVFTNGGGFVETKTYAIRSDAGSTIPPNERYHVTSYGEAVLSTSTINNIIDGVWDETLTDHLIPGSTGEAVNEISADTTQLRLDTINLLNWVDELLKYTRNRTVIDKLNQELIVYNDNGTSIFKRFKLKDSNGIPSVTEVCERDPI